MSDDKYSQPCGFATIDVYRVLKIFDVTDPCIQHAVKKLLCAGQRGQKSVETDIEEAIQSLERWGTMRAEEAVMPKSVDDMIHYYAKERGRADAVCGTNRGFATMDIKASDCPACQQWRP